MNFYNIQWTSYSSYQHSLSLQQSLMGMQIVISYLVKLKLEEGELVGSPYDRLGMVHVSILQAYLFQGIHFQVKPFLNSISELSLPSHPLCFLEASFLQTLSAAHLSLGTFIHQTEGYSLVCLRLYIDSLDRILVVSTLN